MCRSLPAVPRDGLIAIITPIGISESQVNSKEAILYYGIWAYIMEYHSYGP